MKKASLFLFILLLTVSAFCQPWDGPFGLKMGLTYNQLKAIDPGIERIDGDLFVMANVPISHPDFEYYCMTIDPQSGLARTGGFTTEIHTNKYGEDLVDKFWEFAWILEEKYGDYEEVSYLNEGSMWDEPDDFMMGLYLEERTLACFWSADAGSMLPNNINYITLLATANEENTGQIMLRYDFNNFSDYYEARENEKKEAF